MTDKVDVKQGTLALMILTTLQGLGPLHGYGIARRIEETSGHRLKLNYGTLYPALLKIEQEGFITAGEGDIPHVNYPLDRGTESQDGGCRPWPRDLRE